MRDPELDTTRRSRGMVILVQNRPDVILHQGPARLTHAMIQSKVDVSSLWSAEIDPIIHAHGFGSIGHATEQQAVSQHGPRPDSHHRYSKARRVMGTAIQRAT